jgi:hypothetical protein
MLTDPTQSWMGRVVETTVETVVDDEEVVEEVSAEETGEVRK